VGEKDDKLASGRDYFAVAAASTENVLGEGCEL